ncbi:hypothetical protein GUJ93_ZPchr0013g35430, partial [Zizania palustris]
GAPRTEVLGQWTGGLAEDATWENLEEMQHQFPASVAWGQATIQGRGDVKSPVECVLDVEQCSKPGKGAQPLREGHTRVRKPNARVVGPEWVV